MSMKYANPKILKNLEIAYKAIEECKPKLFSLSTFNEETTCGTLHCSLGLLGTMPYFNEQKLKFVKRLTGPDYIDEVLTIKGIAVMCASHEWLDELFGDNCYFCLFHTRETGSWDYFNYCYSGPAVGFLRVNPKLTDKELALLRLNHQIKLVKESLRSRGICPT